LQLEEAAAKAAEKADLEMDKQREEYESASKTLAAEKEKLVSEKERSKGLEERIGFMHQKYEKMAAAMQEKISDLEEANTLKSKLENQVHCLRMANSDLEIQLSNKEAELEQESSEKENLQSQIHSLGNKIQDLEELLLQQTSGKHSRVVDTTAQEKPNNSTVLIKDATTPQVILSKSSSECSGSSVGNEGKSTSLNRNKSQQPDYIHVKATKMLSLQMMLFVKPRERVSPARLAVHRLEPSSDLRRPMQFPSKEKRLHARTHHPRWQIRCKSST